MKGRSRGSKGGRERERGHSMARDSTLKTSNKFYPHYVRAE